MGGLVLSPTGGLRGVNGAFSLSNTAAVTGHGLSAPAPPNLLQQQQQHHAGGGHPGSSNQDIVTLAGGIASAPATMRGQGGSSITNHGAQEGPGLMPWVSGSAYGPGPYKEFQSGRIPTMGNRVNKI
jgi:hypothetical protein